MTTWADHAAALMQATRDQQLADIATQLADLTTRIDAIEQGTPDA